MLIWRPFAKNPSRNCLKTGTVDSHCDCKVVHMNHRQCAHKQTHTWITAEKFVWIPIRRQGGNALCTYTFFFILKGIILCNTCKSEGFCFIQHHCPEDNAPECCLMKALKCTASDDFYECAQIAPYLWGCPNWNFWFWWGCPNWTIIILVTFKSNPCIVVLKKTHLNVSHPMAKWRKDLLNKRVWFNKPTIPNPQKTQKQQCNS